MINEPVDLLQIKIEKAREQLPEETRRAIDAVDWKSSIISLREKKGFNFEQLGDLELETELLLCGLVSSEDYPKELEARLKISKNQVDLLVNDLNELIFKKIKDELIKIVEKTKSLETPAIILENPNIKKPVTVQNEIKKEDLSVFKNAGIEILKKEEEPKQSVVVDSREDILKKLEQPKLITPAMAPIIIPKEKTIEKPVINTIREKEKIPDSIFNQKLVGAFQMPKTTTEYTTNPASTSVTKPVPKIDPYREPTE